MLSDTLLRNFENYESSLKSKYGYESDIKLYLNNYVRKEFLGLLEAWNNVNDLFCFIDVAFSISEGDKIDSSVPFILIEDLIEVCSLNSLNLVISYIDAKTQDSVSKLSSKKGNGLILLRSMNLLRKRIVRSEHSELAGVALLLLAKIFPSNERSGLNLKGDRNLENSNLKATTTFEAEPEAAAICKLHSLLYTQTAKLFENNNWNEMVQAVNSVIITIESKIARSLPVLAIVGQNSFDYYYSLNHLLLGNSVKLQMDSAYFRLAVLTQILTLLQDLNTYILENSNFKPEQSHELWIGDVTKKAFYLISLHADGKDYFRFLRSIFRIERFWITWKSNSCPNYEVSGSGSLPIKNDISRTSHRNVIEMGNEELCRLWKYDITEIEDRKLKPPLDDYLESCTEKNQTEQEFCWRTDRINWKIKL